MNLNATQKASLKTLQPLPQDPPPFSGADGGPVPGCNGPSGAPETGTAPRPAQGAPSRRFPGAAASASPAPRKVGTITLGIALIITGLIVILILFRPDTDLEFLFWMPPLLLIALGCEILLRYFFSKDHSYKYDVLSAFVCFLLICGSIGAACLPRVIDYVGPKRHQAEDQLSRQLGDDIYQALQGSGVIGSMDVSLYAQANFLEEQDVQYLPSYSSATLRLLPEYADAAAFASQCRTLMDKLISSGLSQRLDRMDFSGQGPNVHYSLSVSDPFQWELAPEALAQLTGIVKLEPDPADGWLPGGYEEILEAYGPEVADQFLAEAIRQQQEAIGAAEDLPDSSSPASDMAEDLSSGVDAPSSESPVQELLPAAESAATE